MTIPVCKEGPPHLEGAATVNAPPQTHHLLELFGAKPASLSQRAGMYEHHAMHRVLCMALQGRRSLRPVKVVSYVPQARAAVAERRSPSEL